MSAPTTNIITRLSPVKFAERTDISEGKPLQKEPYDEALSVDSNGDEGKRRDQVTCVPFVVEFRRLLQNPKFKSVDVIPGVSVKLHNLACVNDTYHCVIVRM